MNRWTIAFGMISTLVAVVVAFVVQFLTCDEECIKNYFYVIQDLLGKDAVPRQKGSERHNTTMPWCEMMRNNFEVIRDEILKYLEEHEIKGAEYYDAAGNDFLKSYGERYIPWYTLPIQIYGVTSKKIKYFPETSKLVKQIPGMVEWFFSVLPAGGRLPTHHGRTQGVWRYHLSLKAPKQWKKCYIKVFGIPPPTKFHWRDGNDFMFDDTYDHLVTNQSDETRIILILEIKRKYERYIHNLMTDIFLFLARFHPGIRSAIQKVDDLK